MARSGWQAPALCGAQIVDGRGHGHRQLLRLRRTARMVDMAVAEQCGRAWQVRVGIDGDLGGAGQGEIGIDADAARRDAQGIDAQRQLDGSSATPRRLHKAMSARR